MSGIDIFCWGCASSGAVNKVTANLRCSCGSDDIDLYTASKEQLARVAAVRRGPSDFASFMTGRTATGPVGGDVPGWNEYTGPRPSANPMSNHERSPEKCPVCHGSGYDITDKTTCRECGGSGITTPTTTPEPPAVARHNYPSTQTSVPFMGRRKQSGRTSTDPLGSPEQHIKDTTKGYGGEEEEPKHWDNSKYFGDWEPRDYEHKGTPLPLHGASCPNCGGGSTSLVQDRNEDAWWHCPNCGPLANVDRKPHVDPFNPPEDFEPNGKLFKSASRFRKGKKTGRLMDQIVLIGQTNPGLRAREIVGLARTALKRYPEAR